MINTKLTPTEAAKRLLRAADYAGYVSRYTPIREAVYTQLLNMLTQQAGQATPHRGDAMTPTHRADALLAYYREVLCAHAADFNLSVCGLQQATHDHAGLDRYQVSIVLRFGPHCIALEWDVKTSEYVDFDDESLDITLEGDDIQEIMDSEPLSDGTYAFDAVTEAFSGFVRDAFTLGDDDIRDPDDPLLAQDKAIFNLVLAQ